MEREHNQGRLEIRFLECVEMTPSQVGFPGARSAAWLETRVKRKGRWSSEVVYLVSSFTLKELQAQEMLSLKQDYWIVESRLHLCLDITLREDQSQVRTPGAGRILATIRRMVVSLANAAVNQKRKNNPKTKCNTNSFQKRFRSDRGRRERLRALVFPNIQRPWTYETEMTRPTQSAIR